MEFKQCEVKSVKANIANGDMTISFKMAINDDNMETAEALALYVGKDASNVEVRVIPDQPSLKGMFPSHSKVTVKEF